MMQLGGGQVHMVPLFDKKGQQAGELRFRAQEEQVVVLSLTLAVAVSCCC